MSHGSARLHTMPRRTDADVERRVVELRRLFIKPHCPWQNGKVERYNRTLAAEWAHRHPFTTNAARTAALPPWLDYYNNQRRHSALGGQPPISRVLPTS